MVLVYCDTKSSKKRKSCIEVLNVIINCLLKWFAPILTFTTEEIYKIINKDGKSIHLENFPKVPAEWKNKSLEEKWLELTKIRDHCNISIENKRAEKIIGSSLEAKVDIKLDNKLYKKFSNFDFEELLITSKVDVSENSSIKNAFEATTTKANGKKCPVCWKIRENKCERHGEIT